jgi:hypothetical protein
MAFWGGGSVVEELSEREWCWEKVVILGQRLYCICSVESCVRTG